MRPFEFKDLPIKGKLIVVIVLISAVSVSFSTGLFVIQDIVMHRRTAVNDTELVAEVIGANSALALSFQDVGAAEEVLASLSKVPDIDYACIYDVTGKVFARRGEPGETVSFLPLLTQPGTASSVFRDGNLLVHRDIYGENGQRVGSVFIRSRPSNLQAVIRTALLVFPGIVLLGIAVAFGLSNQMHQMICSPILELAGVARTISAARDYGMRGSRRGNDEIGSLVDAFNAMLDEIQKRDNDLRALNESLEGRVRERTIGLEKEIRERQLAEEKLTIYTTQLERSNRELQDFAYVASHDLQEPLRKIQAFGDRLTSTCSEGLGDKGQDYVVRMQNAARRMSILISGLLSFSRVSTRGESLKRVDLNRVLQEVLGDLEVKLTETQGDVQSESLPVIDADPLQMRQLFQNMLGNSLKYHQAGVPPRIRIDSRESDISVAGRMTRVVQLEFHDNGIGFDQRHAEKIFGLFQRLHGRGEYEGVGMGLAICRRIVERHNGYIDAKGQTGVGAVFTIVLPIRSVTGNV